MKNAFLERVMEARRLEQLATALEASEAPRCEVCQRVIPGLKRPVCRPCAAKMAEVPA